MSERFIFHKTEAGIQLHDGDEVMERSKVLNDLWDSYKERGERIAELEAANKSLKCLLDNGIRAAVQNANKIAELEVYIDQLEAKHAVTLSDKNHYYSELMKIKEQGE